MRSENTIRIENLGPILDAEVNLRDLTVLVGPQASGKSIFLQTLKLVLDRNHIFGTFKENNVVTSSTEDFMNCYYGGGLFTAGDKESIVTWRGNEYEFSSITGSNGVKSNKVENLFYIPAQRIISLQSGATRNFGSFELDEPYVLRRFADQVHRLLHAEFASMNQIFPAPGRMNSKLQVMIGRELFPNSRVVHEVNTYKRRLLLKVKDSENGIPFLSWSSGQREFVPLLLGYYLLCPRKTNHRRDFLDWIVVEEPEMGLHPQAISAFFPMLLELMRRGYKVIISTHSTSILDFIWAIQEIKNFGGDSSHVRDLFKFPHDLRADWIVESTLQKDYAVYHFNQGLSSDISSLDPGSNDEYTSNWGGLTGYSDHAADVVAGVARDHFFGSA